MTYLSYYRQVMKVLENNADMLDKFHFQLSRYAYQLG